MNNSTSSFYEIYILEHNKKIIKKGTRICTCDKEEKKKILFPKHCLQAAVSTDSHKKLSRGPWQHAPQGQGHRCCAFCQFNLQRSLSNLLSTFFLFFSFRVCYAFSLFFFFTYLFRYFVSFSLPPRENQLCPPTSSQANWRLPPSVKCPRAKGYAINEILSESAQRKDTGDIFYVYLIFLHTVSTLNTEVLVSTWKLCLFIQGFVIKLYQIPAERQIKN